VRNRHFSFNFSICCTGGGRKEKGGGERRSAAAIWFPPPGPQYRSAGKKGGGGKGGRGRPYDDRSELAPKRERGGEKTMYVTILLHPDLRFPSASGHQRWPILLQEKKEGRGGEEKAVFASCRFNEALTEERGGEEGQRPSFIYLV